jgi:DNA invertase Pin-like site-specific DNA recombinase
MVMIVSTGGFETMRRAYSYIRFSSAKQRRGDSHRRQLAFADRLCKEHGWMLDDSLRLHDLGVSAFRSKNAKVGALAEFLEAVEAGTVASGSVLVLENIDRLSRNKVGDALQLFIRILNHGITVVTAEPERIYTRESINDVASLLEPIIYFARAYDESRAKAMRSRSVWGQKKALAASEGKPLGVPPVAWLELTPDGYRLVPDRAETVRAIFRMAATEGLGKLRIAQALCADPKRYPPFGASKQWNVRYVDLILSNRAAFGEYQRYSADPETGVRMKEGEPIPGFYPAAITEQDFYAARAAMARRKQRSGRPATVESNLFTGITFNAVDKQSMHIRTIRRGETYLATHAVWRGEKWDKAGPFATLLAHPHQVST